MIKKLSVGKLYPFALAEGEGVGTAYEYLAKRLVLSSWLKEGVKPKKVLIAGLPQKYGCSLDFALLADEVGAELTVIDERPEALEKFERSLEAIRAQGQLTALSWESRVTADLSNLAADEDRFDLALSSEVLQRLDDSARGKYLNEVQLVASRVAVFCPNAENPAHTNLSGLSGITKEELAETAGEEAFRTGFIDMPPFPPGLTRTDEQREQATTGRLEAMAMVVLGAYVRLERFIPARIRRQQSHIVFALSRLAS